MHNQTAAGVAIIFAVIAVGLLAATSVKPSSFSCLEYFEFGLKRQKSTGIVWLNKTYSGGRYMHGPDYDFLIYKADAHWLDLIQISVFTRDMLEVQMSAHMQYFLWEDELPLLHQMFNVSYEDVFRTIAVDALKVAMPKYTVRELIENRSLMEEDLYKAVRQRIGGICCRPDCDQYEQACPAGCKPVPSCTDTDKGVHADVMYFQLGKYDIPSNVKSRYMESLVLQEKTLEEKLRQTAVVVRKDTQALVKDIQNEAREMTYNATGQGNQTMGVAVSEYERVLEEARVIGLANSFRSLNITEEQKKAGFDYLRTLLNSGEVRLNINFEQLIAGKL